MRTLLSKNGYISLLSLGKTVKWSDEDTNIRHLIQNQY